MKANELRIGNWVFNKAHERKQLTEVYSDCSVYEQIPLTEEWLLKFGFINGCLEIVNGLLLWVDDELWITYTNGVRSGCLSHIKHVHQLQNLYFAIKGEELTLSK